MAPADRSGDSSRDVPQVEAKAPGCGGHIKHFFAGLFGNEEDNAS